MMTYFQSNKFQAVMMLIVLISILSLAQPTSAQNVVKPPPDVSWLDGLTLVVLDTDDVESLHKARRLIQASGGRVAIMSKPSYLIGWIPEELQGKLLGKEGIVDFHDDEIMPGNISVHSDEGRHIVNYFNSVMRGEVRRMILESELELKPLYEPHIHKDEEPFDAKAFIQYMNQSGMEAVIPKDEDARQAFLEQVAFNCQFMTGTVTVSVFFVESDGSGSDPDVYHWETEEQDHMKGEVRTALIWWSSQAGGYDCQDELGTPINCWVSFFPVFHLADDVRCQQELEPVLNYAYYGEPNSLDWIETVFSNFGCGGYDLNSQLACYNAKAMTENKTDQAYCAFFVANSYGRTTFKDGLSAFMFPRTTCLVMCYVNEDYLHTENHHLFAHETGHIFKACDEYTDTPDSPNEYCDGVCESCDLGLEDFDNFNCQYCPGPKVDCVMKGNHYNLCDYTPNQIGWLTTTTVPTYRTISGVVTDSGLNPVEGIVIGLTNPGEVCPSATTTTAADGSYSIQVNATEPWSTVRAIPQGDFWSFNPEALYLDSIPGDLTGQNFEALSYATEWTQFPPTKGMPVSRIDCLTQLPGSELLYQSSARSLAMTTDGDDGIYIAWCDERNGNLQIFAQRISPLGEIMWSPEGVLVGDAGGFSDEQPFIVPSNLGSALIVWLSNSKTILIRKIDPSGGFPMGPATEIQTTVYSIPYPTIDVQSDGENGALIAWETDFPNEVRAQKISPHGFIMWSPPTGIEFPYGEFPKITTDGNGGAIVAWEGTTPWSIYAMRITQSGNPDIWGSSPVLLVGLGTWAYGAELCSDGNGGAIASWSQGSENRDIVAQRINGQGQLMWGSNGLTVCDASGFQDFQQMAGDGEGGAIIVWEDDRNSATTGQDIYAHHVLANGTLDPNWSSNGNSICIMEGRQFDIKIVPSYKIDTYILAWADNSRGELDIKGDELRETGVSTWVNGTYIADATSRQTRPVVLNDSYDGAFYVWRDSRDGRDDVYAMRHGNYASAPVITAFVKKPDGSLLPMPDNAMIACPAGDEDAVVIQIEWEPYFGEIDRNDIYIDQAVEGNLTVWGVEERIVADNDLTAANDWTTTITHYNLGGCGTDLIPVCIEDMGIQMMCVYAEVNAKSPDYTPLAGSDGFVDILDFIAFSKALNKCAGDAGYNECYDFIPNPFPHLPCVDSDDYNFFVSHYLHSV
jgi:hypothetical protein